jgi:TetR/AcrR family transcriptional regulator, transcriptional repressor of bet genes
MPSLSLNMTDLRQAGNPLDDMTKAAHPPAIDAPARKARRTEDKSVRRVQLIEATIACIAKHGITGTTLAKVTEVAGLSLGLVNFHFATKERLFEETLRFVASEHRAQWQKGIKATNLGDADRFLAIIDSFFHPQICSRKKLSVWFAFFAEAANRSIYRSIVADIDEERHQESMRLIRRFAAEGDGVDPVFVSLTLEALTDGLWLNMLLYPEDFSRAQSKTQVRRVLALMFPRHFGPTFNQPMDSPDAPRPAL